MKKIFLGVALMALMLAVSARAEAVLVPASEYSLESITGSYAWGQTDWNDVAGEGFVDNTADLSKVEDLMSDGYTYSPPYGGGTVNGIYNWYPSGFHALTFGFNDGADYTLDQFSFISSRNYSSSTPISIDYSLDGGAWASAVSTTSGAMGITTGDADTYDLNLGGVTADQFRFTTDGGSQVSLHEIMIYGSAVDDQPGGETPVIPEPASVLLFSTGILGVFFRRRH